MRFGKLAIPAVVLSAAIAAQADERTMQFDGNIAGGDVSITFFGTTESGFAGTMAFTETDLTTPSSSLGNIITLCADLADDFSPPATWSDTVFDPTPLVASFGGFQQALSADSLQRAGGIIQGVATSFGNLGNLNAAQAEGLQLAVWEAIYDPTTGSGTPDFSHGNFIVNSTDQAGALSDATSFFDLYVNPINLNSIFIQKASATGRAGTQGQDMLTSQTGQHRFETPEPFTMSLGLAGVGLFIRRRLKAKARRG